jgi:hypothetical protein
MRLEQDGSFYWSLPKGIYRVNELQVGCDYFVRPQLMFDVPRQGDIAYLGTLKADVDVFGFGKAWWITGIYPIDIVDEAEKATEMLRSHNPTTVSYRIDKLLLRKIPRQRPTRMNLGLCQISPFSRWE